MISDLVFHITPAYAVEHDIDENSQYIIISSYERYDALNEMTNVCVLHFADTEDSKGVDSVSEKDIETIVDCLNNCKYENVHISCDEGVSRSSAITAGLLKCLGRDDSYIWKSTDYRPNVLVYKYMLKYFSPSGPSCATLSELRNIAGRSPEEYRCFRKNSK